MNTSSKNIKMNADRCFALFVGARLRPDRKMAADFWGRYCELVHLYVNKLKEEQG